MRRWFLLIGLAVAAAAVGCGGQGEKPVGESKNVINVQNPPDQPGPGGPAVERQAKEIAASVDKDLTSNSSWSPDAVSKYSKAVENALVEWVQSSKGLSKDQKESLIAAFPDFIKYSLPRSVAADSLSAYVNAAKYGVEMYAGRTPVNEATQKKIDSQIDTFADDLKVALPRYFGERSSPETLDKAAEDVRAGLKACSRNPWFPALKEPLDSDEEKGIRTQIIDQTLATQKQNFEKAIAEGKEIRFDWGDTSAWSAATKFVSKTIKPPSDRTIQFSHSPGSPGIGVQVKPPMMAPTPGGGVAPVPGGPAAPGGGAPPAPAAPRTPPPPPAAPQ